MRFGKVIDSRKNLSSPFRKSIFKQNKNKEEQKPVPTDDKKKMEQDKITDIIKEGLVTKSPPEEKLETHCWKERYCVLCYKELPSIKTKRSASLKSITSIVGMKKKKVASKREDNGSCSSTMSNDNKKGYVFLYYEKKEHVNKYKPIKEFSLQGSTATVLPNGIKDHKYVLKLQLPDCYNNREMYLCFKTKEEHIQWKDALDNCLMASEDDIPLDYIETDKEPEVFLPNLESPLAKELQNIREKIKEEYKERNTILFDDDGATYNTDFCSNGSQQTDSGFSCDSTLNTSNSSLKEL